jgi:hypothetical protein
MPSLVFYISGHGFGHAARDIEVLNAVADRRPDLEIVVRTAAPRWLFDLTLRAPAEIVDVECDTGIAQIDSLRLDARATIARAAEFHRDLEARAAREAAFLNARHASLVVGDIPPLAFAAAADADVPAIALGNFTWDWIYAGYVDEVAAAPDLLPALRCAYREATLALRLPMFGGFEVFGPRVRDVAFVARRSALDRRAARERLGISNARPVVLISFGGYGLASLDPSVFASMDEYTFVLTADPRQGRRAAGEARRDTAFPPNVIEIDEAGLYARGRRYEDLVAAADVVATKPGFGIIAECIANGAAMLYTSRGHFIEYDVLVAAMPRYLRCRFIGHADLFAGRWKVALDALLAQPPAPDQARTDGAEEVAQILCDYA